MFPAVLAVFGDAIVLASPPGVAVSEEKKVMR